MIENLEVIKNDKKLCDELEAMAQSLEKRLSESTGQTGWKMCILAAIPGPNPVKSAAVLPGSFGLDMIHAVLESQGYLVKSPDQLQAILEEALIKLNIKIN